MTVPTPLPLSPAESIADQLAQRIATRDAPPTPDPLRFERANVEARLAKAIAERLGLKHAQRKRNLGRLLYLLVEQARITRAELAEKADLTTQTTAYLANLLVSTGLVRDGWINGRTRWFGLSRAGEDWALPIVQGESAPIR